MAGPVGGVAGAHHRRLAEVARVAAEAPLRDLTLGRAAEGQAHVLQLDDGVDRLARQHLGGVLVGQVIATLDGVEHVPFPVVLFEVAEGRADAPLRRAGVRARRVELGDHRHVGLAGQLDRRHQPRAAGADDHDVVLVIVRRALRGHLLHSSGALSRRVAPDRGTGGATWGGHRHPVDCTASTTGHPTPGVPAKEATGARDPRRALGGHRATTRASAPPAAARVEPGERGSTRGSAPRSGPGQPNHAPTPRRMVARGAGCVCGNGDCLESRRCPAQAHAPVRQRRDLQVPHALEHGRAALFRSRPQR